MKFEAIYKMLPLAAVVQKAGVRQIVPVGIGCALYCWLGLAGAVCRSWWVGVAPRCGISGARFADQVDFACQKTKSLASLLERCTGGIAHCKNRGLAMLRPETPNLTCHCPLSGTSMQASLAARTEDGVNLLNVRPQPRITQLSHCADVVSKFQL